MYLGSPACVAALRPDHGPIIMQRFRPKEHHQPLRSAHHFRRSPCNDGNENLGLETLLWPTDQTDQTGLDQTGVKSAEQRLPIKDHGSWIKDQGSWIMDQGSWIMDQESWIMNQGLRIKDQAPWTLFWHEWSSWKGYGRDIKTIQIYDQRPIILYRFYKDPIKDQASWTLFWHEWPF